MRRAALALAIAVGLAIGTVVPASALGLTQVTLTCNDGTNVTYVVDTDTLTGLVQGVQAMIDYPAGLTCGLVQIPVIVGIGGIALAAPGTSPFIVGGGRWQVPCGLFPGGGGGGSVEAPMVARGRGELMSPAAFAPSAQPTDQSVSVNIAVNFHQAADGSFFGTLNETIPANQFCFSNPVGESHFTSKPEASPTGCFAIDASDPHRAYVVSHMTQTSGLPFPSGGVGSLNVGDDIHFSFIDNGNPGQQPPGVSDMLQGPPAFDDSKCVRTTSGAVGTRGTDPADPAFNLTNGNITLHPKPTP